MLNRKSQSWIKYAMPLLAIVGFTILLSVPANADDLAPSAIISLVTSGISNHNSDCNSAIIQWETNGDATSQVFYDVYSHENDDSYAYSTVEDMTLVPKHWVRITGLNEGTEYYYRVKSVIPGTGYLAVSEEYAFVTPHCTTTQGESSTYNDYYLRVRQFGEDWLYRISKSGVLLETIEFSSQDGKMVIIIPKGTYALDNYGRRLEFIEAEIFEDEPLLPLDCCLVGDIYSFEPVGAQFDPPIQLLITYDSNDLANDIMEQDLFTAYCNETNTEWTPLESEFNMEDRIFEVNIEHFTMFTVLSFITPSLSPIAEVSSTPTPAPNTTSAPSSALPSVQPEEATKSGITWPILGLISVMGSFLIIFRASRIRKRSSNRIKHSVPLHYSNR